MTQLSLGLPLPVKSYRSVKMYVPTATPGYLAEVLTDDMGRWFLKFVKKCTKVYWALDKHLGPFLDCESALKAAEGWQHA